MILAFYSEASGTGKDTAANFAAARFAAHGKRVVRDAFAWDGKVLAADALGIEGTRAEKIAMIDRLKLDGFVSWGVPWMDFAPKLTGREFLIGLLGTPDKHDGVRGLDDRFWTNQVLRRDEEFTADEAGYTVVSDMRFIEEAQAVKGAGGRVVEIVRNESLGRFNEQRISPDLIDHTIHNFGTLEELEREVSWYVVHYQSNMPSVQRAQS